MIRMEGEILTVRLGSDRQPLELTGKMLPCPAPTCPCALVFLTLAPRDRPQECVSCAVDVDRRVAVQMQGMGRQSTASFRTRQEIAARFRDEHGKTLARLLRDGKANGTGISGTGAGGMVIVAGEWPPGRNAPCPCRSGKKFKRCCGGNGDATSSRFASN